jgi:hypothetical protein
MKKPTINTQNVAKAIGMAPAPFAEAVSVARAASTTAAAAAAA